MSIRSGFFNSVNHDRLYTTEDISEIFNGIFSEGIFKDAIINGSYDTNNCLRVIPYQDMVVYVEPGKAWFKNVWILNDTKYPVVVPESNMILNRWDAIVLEIDKNKYKRSVRFIVISGEEADEPEKPIIHNSHDVYYYVLAYIYVGKNVSSISADDIVDMVGTDGTPYAVYIGASPEFNIANNLSTTTPGKVLDAVQGHILSERLPFHFGIDSNGKYGYIKNGETEIVPFLNERFVNLGSGTSFDLSRYPGYENFVVNRNIFLVPTKITNYATVTEEIFDDAAYLDFPPPSTETKSALNDFSPGLSYNSSTGILTVNNISSSIDNKRITEVSLNDRGKSSYAADAVYGTVTSMTYNVYLIY